MNVLIVAHNFPPLNSIATYRVYSFAKEFLKQGYNVTVLTTYKYHFIDNINFYPNDEYFNKFEIIEVEYANFITNKFKKAPIKVKDSSKVERNNKLIKTIKTKVKSLLSFLDISIFDFWINAGYKEGKKILDQKKYDIIFSSYSTASSHIIASKLKKKYPNIFWIADYRDLWSNHDISANNHIITNTIRKKKEFKTIKNANILTTVSEPLSKCLNLYTNKKTYSIENGYEEKEINNLEKMNYFNNNKITRLVFTGTMYHEYDIEPLFQAIEILKNKKIINKNNFQILFYGLSDGLKKYDYKKYFIKINSIVPKMDALRIQRDADGLLFFDWKEIKKDICSQGDLSGKTFEYMASGTEIFSISNNHNSIANQLIRKCNVGESYSYDNIDVLVKKIKHLILYGKSITNPNIQLLQQYTRDNKAKSFLDIVTKEYLIFKQGN